MIKSKQTYSPQNFVDAVTGYCYIFRQEDTVKEIHNLLKRHGFPLRDYPINKIENIVENNIPVVLVDVSGFKGDKWVQEYRWFEVPDDFLDEDE